MVQKQAQKGNKKKTLTDVPLDASLGTLKRAQEYFDLWQNFQQLGQELLTPEARDYYLNNVSLVNPWMIGDVLGKAGQKIFENPQNFYRATEQYSQQLSDLMKSTVEMSPDLLPLTKKDKRFKDPEWTNNPYFKFLKDSYLLWDKWIEDVFENVEGLDEETARKARFFTRLIRDSVSPNNFFWLNPMILKKTIDTQGNNLMQGLGHLIKDLEHGQGQLDIQMVDPKDFQLGENLATTPGSVVFQNDLFQLIQYKPTTEKVYQIPLLIIPPCINKYYIFDLREHNSFVKWCVDEGYTVFIISWVNPDQDTAHKTFEDYVFQGLLEAVSVAKEICDVEKINALGFCIGGNFLAPLSGYLAVQKTPNPLNSTTYLATIFDFKDAGDLKVFVDKKQLEDLETQIKGKGYLDGRILARTFSLLRANDLIWSFVISKYFMGESPAAFDLLYWNSDSTNLPAAMYTYYLRKMFIENKLLVPGGITLRDVSIDLKKVVIDSFILNTKEDHIAPWRSGYEGACAFSGDTKFCLGGSGHVAGIFNAPKDKKYSYWVGPSICDKPEEWLDLAQEKDGSWWVEWEAWIQERSGAKVLARDLNHPKHKAIEPAPGSYVKIKINDPAQRK